MADKKGGSIDWNKTVFRSITTKQFVAMIIAFALGLIILCIGLGGSVIGWLLTAVILYIYNAFRVQIIGKNFIYT